MREPDAEGRVRRAVRHGEPVIGIGLLDGRHGCAQVGALVKRDFVEMLQRVDILFEIETAVDIELVDRRALVEQGQKGDLRGAEICQRGLIIGLVLHALQMDALHVHLRDIAGVIAILRNAVLLLEIIQLFFRQRLQVLGLQGLHKSVPQVKQQGALLIGLLQSGDAGGLLRAFETQLALMLTLVQVADRRREQSARQTAARRLGWELSEFHPIEKVKSGFGRRKAVISLALASSTLTWLAINVGLEAMKRCFT